MLIIIHLCSSNIQTTGVHCITNLESELVNIIAWFKFKLKIVISKKNIIKDFSKTTAQNLHN